MQQKWFVTYEVPGHGTKYAGPYCSDDVGSQRRDVAGYEGVLNVRVLTSEQLPPEVSARAVPAAPPKSRPRQPAPMVHAVGGMISPGGRALAGRVLPDVRR